MFNLQQITEKIIWFKKQNRKLAEEISIWEQKESGKQRNIF
ncbi:hypothetical protein VULLAG_LOCUS10478 [Vulpes lagopus]